MWGSKTKPKGAMHERLLFPPHIDLPLSFLFRKKKMFGEYTEYIQILITDATKYRVG